jgi:hypothetical protein
MTAYSRQIRTKVKEQVMQEGEGAKKETTGRNQGSIDLVI